MGKTLTQELIAQKTKTEQIHLVKNLNLWGNDLDDISIIRSMPNLEVCSLSVNKISSLRDFSYCPKLRELFLRNNQISEIKELAFLTNLQNLRILWLSNNPVARSHNFRLIVIKALPNLANLDDVVITQEEKQQAEGIQLEDHFKGVSLDDEYDQPPQDFISEPPQIKQKYSQRNEPYQGQSNEPNTPQRLERHQSDQPKYQPNYDSNPQKYQQNYESNQPPRQTPQNQLNYYQPEEQNFRNYQQSPQIQRMQSLETRNENIVMAILALLKELDESSLEVVRRDVERKIGQLRMNK